MSPPCGCLLLSSLCPQATLSLLLDHLSLVASFSSSNRMTHQNLAVCFGPVLLTPTQEAWRVGGGGGGRGGAKGLGHGEEIASAVDFKRHIEALHYLLQLWPGETAVNHKLRPLSHSCAAMVTAKLLTGCHVAVHVLSLSADPSSPHRRPH